jgi:hypothetical protein
MYENNVETVTYKIGTVNIDVVHAKEKQLIWKALRKVGFGRQTSKTHAKR